MGMVVGFQSAILAKMNVGGKDVAFFYGNLPTSNAFIGCGQAGKVCEKP
jgi:hypothetical protein